MNLTENEGVSQVLGIRKFVESHIINDGLPVWDTRKESEVS